MKKLYKAPSLAVYGSLTEITMGVGGTSPDVVGVNNNSCFTGVIGTQVITCVSNPTS